MTKKIITRLGNWPIDQKLRPVFTCTQDALLYAQLIINDIEKQQILSIAREDCYIKLTAERTSKQPNLQRMCNLAVQAQFYRECLEEVDRIKEEH